MRVLLGVCGGIAAYKSASLVRRFREAGCDVRCALTPAAERFVSPLTLEVLSGHRVYGESYLEAHGRAEEEHIEAAAWADALVIAPATANMLGRLAHGLAEEFLSTTALAFEGAVFVAPAMHAVMWTQPAVEANVASLRERGVRFVGPEEGPLASGEVGLGRMAEPETIVAAVMRPSGPLAGRSIVVTAGPTHEAVDEVRFLGNRSSGKMGFALAAEAARRGATVTLIAGPVVLPTPRGVARLDVVTAQEMDETTRREAAGADVVVMAAAVADYRPHEKYPGKLKKADGVPVLDLVENPDILLGLATAAAGALRVGFAAETRDLEAHAQGKLASKRAHVLVANDVSRADIGFGSDENEVIIYLDDHEPVRLERASKSRIAEGIWDVVGARLARGVGTP